MYLKVTTNRFKETRAMLMSEEDVRAEIEEWESRERDGLDVIEVFDSGATHIRWSENVGLYHTAYIPVECVEGLMP